MLVKSNSFYSQEEEIIFMITFTKKSNAPGLSLKLRRFNAFLNSFRKRRDMKKLRPKSRDKNCHCECNEAISSYRRRLPRTLQVLAMII
jgi:hypothetical protein